MDPATEVGREGLRVGPPDSYRRRATTGRGSVPQVVEETHTLREDEGGGSSDVPRTPETGRPYQVGDV